MSEDITPKSNVRRTGKQKLKRNKGYPYKLSSGRDKKQNVSVDSKERD